MLPDAAWTMHSLGGSPEMPRGLSSSGRPANSATATTCWGPVPLTFLFPPVVHRRPSDGLGDRRPAGSRSPHPGIRHSSGQSSGGRIPCEARQKGGQSVNRRPQFGHFRRKIHDRNILTQPSTTSRNVRFRRSWQPNVASLSQPGQAWQYEGSSPDSTRRVWVLIFSSIDMML